MNSTTNFREKMQNTFVRTPTFDLLTDIPGISALWEEKPAMAKDQTFEASDFELLEASQQYEETLPGSQKSKYEPIFFLTFRKMSSYKQARIMKLAL